MWDVLHERPLTDSIRRLNAYMLWYSLRSKPDLDTVSEVIAVREEVRQEVRQEIRQESKAMSNISREDKEKVKRSHRLWKKHLPSLIEASEKVPEMTQIMKELNDRYDSYKSAWEWFWSMPVKHMTRDIG